MQHSLGKLVYDLQFTIEELEGFLNGVGRDHYLSDTGLQRIVEREIEIIGECLNRISRDHPETFYKIRDASKIIGMRNIIAHGYDQIDHRIIWDTIHQNLSLLSSDVLKLKQP